MSEIKTYNDIAFDILRLRKQMQDELQSRCRVVMNKLDMAVDAGQVKPSREVALCKSIWDEFNAIPVTIRNTCDPDISSELTTLIETAGYIPNFKVWEMR
jgi:hypothetical protein